jgi:hypothetical protein
MSATRFHTHTKSRAKLYFYISLSIWIATWKTRPHSLELRIVINSWVCSGPSHSQPNYSPVISRKFQKVWLRKKVNLKCLFERRECVWGSEGIPLFILNLGAKWRWLKSFTHLSHFAPGLKSSNTNCGGGCVGPRLRSGHFKVAVKGLANTTCCRYSCLRSWSWVVVRPEIYSVFSI